MGIYVYMFSCGCIDNILKSILFFYPPPVFNFSGSCSCLIEKKA